VENFITIQTTLQIVQVQQGKVDFYVRFGFMDITMQVVLLHFHKHLH